MSGGSSGMVHVYTGGGKGKSTAALGLALRAVGHGYRVCIIQFLKGSACYGELFAAARLAPDMRIMQFGRSCPHDALLRQGEMSCRACPERGCFVHPEIPSPEDRQLALLALKRAGEAVSSRAYDVVVLDEVNVALDLGLVGARDVLDIMIRKGPVELVLTGRGAPEEIMEAADIVTEMVERKHPFRGGVAARRGVEF